MGGWEVAPFGRLGGAAFGSELGRKLGGNVVALFPSENSVRRAGAINAVEVGLAHSFSV